MPYDVTKDFAPLAQVANHSFRSVCEPDAAGELIEGVRRLRQSAPRTIELCVDRHRRRTASYGRTPEKASSASTSFTSRSKAHHRQCPKLIAGRVQHGVNTIPAFQPHVKSGRIKALVSGCYTTFVAAIRK
jgi:hypothetical protein